MIEVKHVGFGASLTPTPSGHYEMQPSGQDFIQVWVPDPNPTPESIALTQQIAKAQTDALASQQGYVAPSLLPVLQTAQAKLSDIQQGGHIAPVQAGQDTYSTWVAAPAPAPKAAPVTVAVVAPSPAPAPTQTPAPTPWSPAPAPSSPFAPLPAPAPGLSTVIVPGGGIGVTTSGGGALPLGNPILPGGYTGMPDQQTQPGDINVTANTPADQSTQGGSSWSKWILAALGAFALTQK